MLDALQFLSLNEDLLTSARGDVVRSLIATYKSLGGGWQLREGNDFITDELKEVMGERTNWGAFMEAGGIEPVEESERGSWRSPDF